MLNVLGKPIGATQEPTKVTVGPSGRNYTSIQAAIDAVTGTKEKPVNVMIYPGTYNETISPKDYVNLIGINRDTCIIDFAGVEGSEVDYATIKNRPGNIEIKNLTIKGQFVKYCIHFDDGSIPYSALVENCVLIKNGDAANFNQAIGLGLYGDQMFIIKNSVITGAASATNTKGALYCHTWNNQSKPCKLQVENCLLTGAPSGIELSSLASNMSDVLIMRGNKFEGTLYDVKFERYGGAVRDDWVVYAEGNECQTLVQVGGSLLTLSQPNVEAPTITQI